MIAAQRETATPGQGRGGGTTWAVPASTDDTPCPAIRQIRLEVAAITAYVETGLATIKQARDAAARSISAAGKVHWRTVADDEAHRLGDLLRIHAHAPGTVPPSDRAIRRGLAAYQALADAMIEHHAAWAAAAAAWERGDLAKGERQACRSASAKFRAESMRTRHPFGGSR